MSRHSRFYRRRWFNSAFSGGFAGLFTSRLIIAPIITTPVFITGYTIYDDINAIAIFPLYTRNASSCMCVGYVHSPESLTCVSSSGFPLLPRYDAP
ncbi:hypothetical protein EDI29_01130 [Pectobacterium polonicum]|nr:hypothetical protein EDI29_01130 [Pectobacterium polonicum]